MSEHKGSTDSVHQVKLTSAIQTARWSVSSIVAGTEAPFEVHTLFVGDGAEARLTFLTDSGKKVGKLAQTVGCGSVRGVFSVPRDLRDPIRFQVELPKHRLKAEALAVPVLPPREIRDPRWDREEARRGDQVRMLAETSGIPEGEEVEIAVWEHDEDGAHDFVVAISAPVRDGKIDAPWEFVYVEDTDDIPRDEQMQAAGGSYVHPEYFFKVHSRGVEAESGLLRFKDWIEIELRDRDGNPVADEEYVLHLPDGSERRGRLDASGKAVEEDLPPGLCIPEFPNRA